MKKAFVIGHHYLSQGAYSKFLKESEFTYMSKVAKYLPPGDVYFHNPYIQSYKKRMKEVSKKLNKYDLVLKLHFNAFNEMAKGCEALYYYKNIKGENIANKFIDAVHKEFSINKREAKGLDSKKQRGYRALYYPKPTTLILEPFFGDNEEDAAKFKGKYKKYAKLLIEL